MMIIDQYEQIKCDFCDEIHVFCDLIDAQINDGWIVVNHMGFIGCCPDCFSQIFIEENSIPP